MGSGRDTLNDSVIRDFTDIRWMDKIVHDLVNKQHTVVSHRSPPAPLISMLLTHKGHAGFRSCACALFGHFGASQC